MAKLWVGNMAPEVTEEDLKAFLVKYGFPEANAIERIGSEGTHPGAMVVFAGKTTSELRELAARVHGMYWRGHTLNVQVA